LQNASILTDCFEVSFQKVPAECQHFASILLRGFSEISAHGAVFGLMRRKVHKVSKDSGRLSGAGPLRNARPRQVVCRTTRSEPPEAANGGGQGSPQGQTLEAKQRTSVMSARPEGFWQHGRRKVRAPWRQKRPLQTHGRLWATSRRSEQSSEERRFGTHACLAPQTIRHGGNRIFVRQSQESQ
jgi:hypothetical protein